ncbi:sortase A [Leucobacter luti]|uniref:Sortase A n=1 Tax=Leucobacter luti TaxID=340320 RepID=A0A4R6S9J5_9MICO|nr:class C sortase [Leucobacter luti]TDP95606.1 sortase A [Leucobacter luti]
MPQQTMDEAQAVVVSPQVSSAAALPPAPPGSDRRWRKPSPVVLCVAVLALAGVGLLQLPSIATWFSQLQYSQEIIGLNQSAIAGGVSEREAELAAAHAYNDQLTGAAVVAPGERIPQAADPGAGSAYAQLLATDSTGLMSRIKIPKIDVDLPIYHGTSDRVLEQGVGHLEGTALPVGGDTTHTVLTGHRGLAQAEMFNNLDRLVVGDTFTLETWGQVLTYRITDTRVVKPDETQSLYPVQGKDLATLVTCTPLGINSHRILVTGERITPTPIADIENAGQAPTVPGFPWWTLWSAAALIVIGGYVVASCRVRGGRSGAGTVSGGVPPAAGPRHA